MSNEGRENNADWDGIWEVRARIAETGWYAEIRIPFRTLRFRTSDVQTWGVNFERKVRRLNEDSHWAPLPRIYQGLVPFIVVQIIALAIVTYVPFLSLGLADLVRK